MIYTPTCRATCRPRSPTPPWPSQGSFATIIAENVDHHRQDRSSTSFDPGFTKQNSYYNSKTGMESHAHLGTPVAKASDSNRRAGQVHEAVHHHAQRGRRQHHPRGPADKPRLHHIAENVYIIIDKIVRLRHSTRAFHQAELVLQLEDGHMESHAHLGTPPSPQGLGLEPSRRASA